MDGDEDDGAHVGDAIGDALSFVAMMEWLILSYIGAVILVSASSRFGDPFLDVSRNGLLVGLMLAFVSSPMALCMLVVRGTIRRLLVLGLGMATVVVVVSVDTTCVAPITVSVIFARLIYWRGAGGRF